MYAVFEDGSRQYRVSEGDVVQVDYREAELGTRLEFGRVLLYQSGEVTHIGQPTVEGGASWPKSWNIHRGSCTSNTSAAARTIAGSVDTASLSPKSRSAPSSCPAWNRLFQPLSRRYKLPIQPHRKLLEHPPAQLDKASV